MKTIAELLALLEVMANEMESLLDKAKAEKDPAKAKTLTDAFQLKVEEYNATKGEYDKAKMLEEAKSFVQKGKETHTKIEDPPDMAGKSLNPGTKPPDKTKEPEIDARQAAEKEDREVRKAFVDFIEGKSISEKLMNVLRPEDKISRFNAGDGQTTVIVPASMAKTILAIVFRGKDKLLTGTSVQTTGGATDTGLGNLWPTVFVPEMLREPVYVPNIVDMVRRVPAANGKGVYPKLDSTQGEQGGLAFTWKATSAEAADKGQTAATFVQLTFETREVSGWTEMSLTSLRRAAVDVEAFLNVLIGESLRKEFSRVIIKGTGVNEPTGIITASGRTQVVRETVSEVSYGDLVALKYGVKRGYRAGGVFILADGAEGFLVDQVDSVGRPLFSTDVASGMSERLLGQSFVTHDYAHPVLGEEGDICFGVPTNYLFGVEQDIAIARSDHAEFKKGLTVIRVMAYVGGKPAFDAGFGILKATTT